MGNPTDLDDNNGDDDRDDDENSGDEDGYGIGLTLEETL